MLKLHHPAEWSVVRTTTAHSKAKDTSQSCLSENTFSDPLGLKAPLGISNEDQSLFTGNLRKLRSSMPEINTPH